MKNFLILLLVAGGMQSAHAADWVLTKYYPWIFDPDVGWYFVPQMSNYVWSEEAEAWMPNPLSSEITSYSYPIVDTNQSSCFDIASFIEAPGLDSPYFGQDAQHVGNQPSYTDNGDGTVSDNVTGLMWSKSPDTDGDGVIEEEDKLLRDEIDLYASQATTGGYTDWRVPTIKELYSLIQFNGTDPNVEATDTSSLVPFIDTAYFSFAYGDTSAGARIIDSQYWSSNDYVSDEVMPTTFGVNFADGRIKGYGLNGMNGTGKTMFLLLVRGSKDYGINQYSDNGDGTVTDLATGLMWQQEDSQVAMDWLEALAWVQDQNASSYLGYTDWRLPNAKELQSIIDYDRSPATSSSAAIDPVLKATVVLNENGVEDYAFYWSSTTHIRSGGNNTGSRAVYLAFGRSPGYMFNNWVDVHGAGSQRSDPKVGDPDEFATGMGPQGDAIRIYNFARLVRDAD